MTQHQATQMCTCGHLLGSHCGDGKCSVGTCLCGMFTACFKPAPLIDVNAGPHEFPETSPARREAVNVGIQGKDVTVLVPEMRPEYDFTPAITKRDLLDAQREIKALRERNAQLEIAMQAAIASDFMQKNDVLLRGSGRIPGGRRGVANTRVREELAAVAHQVWADWMESLFDQSEQPACFVDDAGDHSGVLIPMSLVNRWKRQMTTAYLRLSEEEKKSDREIADRYLAVVHQGIGELFKEPEPQEETARLFEQIRQRGLRTVLEDVGRFFSFRSEPTSRDISDEIDAIVALLRDREKAR